MKRVMFGTANNEERKKKDEALKAKIQKLCTSADPPVDAGKGLFARLDLNGDGKLLKKELVLALDETAGLYNLFATSVRSAPTHHLHLST